MTTTITRLAAPALTAHRGELAALLVDIVAAGASLGFLAGLDHEEAAAWWDTLLPSVEEGSLALWAARGADGRLEGTVSWYRESKPNGRHRAELRKLMVHPAARGRGTARALLAEAERAAALAGIVLLFLDTETGSGAEHVYRSAGWTEAGTIPDYATDPSGILRPTTLFYKHPKHPKQAGHPGHPGHTG
ncbi:GNAT family N-acetyltransferase [Streptomyces katrae]|uniref:GNAT family N-acetyltransferase n=1 Tax=Streptomyces katrae TaxID=68223 RepID=A0ABT7GKT5_9ACTN|nr:GNAT family N-acetyltransferase [Streptomyces katrae]MDK9494198.1 GNAT family N-acetyltransferase [Streptomyces katrae]